MTAYLILSGIIILVSGTSFFVIKKLRASRDSYKFKFEYAEREIELFTDMKNDYKALLIEKAERNKKDYEFIKSLKAASGSVLADMANKL